MLRVANSRIRVICASVGLIGLLLLGAQGALASDDVQLCDNSINDPDEGIPACTRIINGAQVSKLETVFNNRGNAWFRKGLYPNAIADYGAAIERNPRFIEAFRNRGFVLIKQNEFDRAIVDLNQSISLDPKSSFAFYLRGFALYSKGELERSIRDFDAAIALNGDYYAAYLHRGDAWYRKRDYDKALKDFDQAIRISPKDPTAFNERAQVWIDRSQFDRAIQDYGQAIALKPDDWRAYSGRGESLRLKGDLDAAMASHNEAVKLNAASADALINRALVWKDKNELDQAISDYDDALLINPKEDRALSNRGEVWRLKGDLTRSLTDLDKAIALLPNSALTLCRRGDTLRERGDLDRSISDYSSALMVSASAICAYTGRGLALERKNSLKEAKADYDKALTLVTEKDPDPESGRQAQATARIRIAKLAEDARLETEKRVQAEKEQARLANEKLLADKAAQQLLARQSEADAAKKLAELENAKRTAEKLRLATAAPTVPPKPIIDQGKRVALVIGNSTYQNVQHLPNPLRDADAVAEALRNVGFQSVQVEHDLTREQLTKALRRFEDVAATANWAVIYYAGHGIVLNGENYLVPVDARLVSDRDVQDEAVPLDRVLLATERAAKLRMVLLDACRENPFIVKMKQTVASRSLTRGLAAIEPGVGTLVAYAARDGQVALDGNGDHSPFATAILNHLQTPNLEIGMFFRIVRDDVRSATRRQQEPFVYGSLPGEDFYFTAK
jgi:tetratricopeptide (TPR) repeat protein